MIRIKNISRQCCDGLIILQMDFQKVKDMKFQMRQQTIIGTLFIFTTFFFLLSLITHHPKDNSLFYYDDNQDVKNILGILGSHVSAALFYFFGGAAYYVCLLLLISGFIILKKIEITDEWDRIAGALLFCFLSPCFLGYFALDVKGIMPGGLIGQSFVSAVTESSYDIIYLGFLYVLSFACCLILTRLSLMRPVQYVAQTRISILIKGAFKFLAKLFYFIAQKIHQLWKYYIKNEEIEVQISDADMIWATLDSFELTLDNTDIINDTFWQSFHQKMPQENFEQPLKPVTQITDIDEQNEVNEQIIHKKKEIRYSVPPLSLLLAAQHSIKINEADLKARAHIVEEKLSHFGVKGEVVSITPGPVVTLFEFQPAIDIKVSRILALEDDLALALKAHSLRIIAPIPGKSVVGFEVANIKREILYLAPLIKSDSFKNDTSHIPIVLGHDAIGTPVIVDLTSAPHLLIAGSTGSGKSVALNVILTSMLYKCKPDELRLVLIDPKRLEFAAYADIPHLLCPIVTHPSKAVLILKWVLQTMEERYDHMAEVGVRNIHDYKNFCKQRNRPDEMPFIVVMIDELADLMLVAGADIEDLLARIAQMARAAGIHLIVATQRPSVDVITGIVKVNFPSRVAFKVASKIDSRTILDSSGAEKLLGKGDMLYLSPSGTLDRLHGAYISVDETVRVVEHIKRESPAQYLIHFDELIASEESHTADDPLYHEIVSYVKTIDEISISQLQRRFRIGYNRSARIIEMLEGGNIITPADGSKMRKVIR